MDLLLSSAAISLFAVTAVWLAGRRDPARSPLLTFGNLLVLLALPLLALLPKITVELPAVANSNAPLAVSTVSWFAMAWFIGFGFFAVRLLCDFAALNRWRRKSSPVEDPELEAVLDDCRRQLGVRRTIGIRLHPDSVSPSISGLFRPIIYLPESSYDWTEETLRMVLLHELGHVLRRDLWTSLAARSACLLHWFNPLVWWLRGRLMAQCEFACDAKVIAVGADPANYAHALCDVAESSAVPRVSLAMAGRASLRQRVERLVRHQRTKGSLLVGAGLLLSVSASLALSVVRLSAPHADQPFSFGPVIDGYSAEEIHTRLTADPFPADE